ncbi:hypothetical protein TNCV_1945191 [Trichonephila clavipes]|nr:hypothetical protein TNCV_1945191 [Trichonephila clavipes]
MEVCGMQKTFLRSEQKHGLKYQRCIGYGDSKTFLSIAEKEPYEDSVPMVLHPRVVLGFTFQLGFFPLLCRKFLLTWEVERGKFYDPARSLLKSKNQEINRLQLAVKLPWAIFFESVDILS